MRAGEKRKRGEGQEGGLAPHCYKPLGMLVGKMICEKAHVGHSEMTCMSIKKPARHYCHPDLVSLNPS